MPTSSPGSSSSGFATLDAVIAVLVLSLALLGMSALLGSLRANSDRRIERISHILRENSASDSSGWVYEAERESP